MQAFDRLVVAERMTEETEELKEESNAFDRVQSIPPTVDEKLESCLE
jgi:hypothetical protein